MVSADSSQCAVRAYRGPLKRASEYITIHRTHCSILTLPPHVCVRVPEGQFWGAEEAIGQKVCKGQGPEHESVRENSLAPK